MKRIAFALAVLTAPFLAQAQTTPVTCTAASLSGSYALVLVGRDVPANAVLTKNYEAVGTIKFDGVGAVTATLTANTNQSANVAQTLSGTYTIPANCVGTMNITTGDIASFTIIPYNKGLNFTITGYDGTYQFTGSGAPQPASCLTSTLSGVYAFSGNGYALGSGAITGVNDISGLLEFDGAGAVTGNWSIATNGSAAADTISGKYTVSGCVASATVTDPTNLAYTLNFTVTSADGSNLSLTGATATNSFNATAHSTFTNPGLAVANAAGVSGGTPPGSLFSIYGFGLSTNNGVTTTTTWPTLLANASVTVNGELAPLYYVSPIQINAQMPLDIAPGVATVIVKNGSALSNSAAATVPATAVPGVLIYGSNRALAENLPSYDVNSTTAAAPAGSYIVVYFTGGGPVQGGSALVTGKATPSTGGVTYPLTENATATVGGTNAPIVFIGLAPGFVGLYQANIQIPTIAAGNHNLILTVNGTASNTTVISTK